MESRDGPWITERRRVYDRSWRSFPGAAVASVAPDASNAADTADTADPADAACSAITDSRRQMARCRMGLARYHRGLAR